jgi:hypothetical protein
LTNSMPARHSISKAHSRRKSGLSPRATGIGTGRRKRGWTEIPKACSRRGALREVLGLRKAARAPEDAATKLQGGAEDRLVSP